MLSKRQETIGVVFVLLSALLNSIAPLIANSGSKNIPSLIFASSSLILSALFFLIICIKQNNLHELKKKNNYFNLLMVVVFIIIIPYILFFIGTKKTSGLNSSLFQLFELIFTLILAYYIGERNSFYKYIGAGGIFIGSAFLLYRGSLSFNLGDILIILSTACFPIGNFYAKKALNTLSPSVILFIRYFFGGIFVLLLSFIIEDYSNFSSIIQNYWLYIVGYGILTMPLGAFFWYKSLKILDISKAVSLVMLYPFFSVLILMGLGEKISNFQYVGIAIILIGTYFSVKRPSTDPKLTKYAQV